MCCIHRLNPHQKAFIAAQLAAGQASPELAARINGSLEGGLTVVIVLTLVGLVWNVGQVLYLRYLILNPVRSVITTFNEIAAGAGDFSRDLKPISHDEFRELAESYNRFAEKMRGIISEIRKASIGIATEAVQVKVRVDETGKGARRQGEMTELVFTASTEATQAIDEVSHSTQLISDSTSTNLDGARISLREMQEISSKINGVGEKVLRFNQTVDDLSQRSASINQIAALIREVAIRFDALPPQQVVDKLKPLSVPGNPWFGSAGELSGMALLKLGKPDLAGAMFVAVASDKDVPASLRTRMRQIAGQLGYEVSDSATVAPAAK